MAGSAPLGDGRTACGTDRDGPSRIRPPPRVAGAALPRGISGDGRPPGRPQLPQRPRNAARCSWLPHDRPFLVLAESYLGRTSTPGSIHLASGHASAPTSRSHPAPSCLARSSKRLQPA
ncbi:unnamed protein product [Urochloa humidicola]